MKIIVGTIVAAGLGLTVAAAQEQQVNPRDTITAPYTTPTGETVPNPGKSQSGGTTKLDRGIQREDNKIDSSICKGC